MLYLGFLLAGLNFYSPYLNGIVCLPAALKVLKLKDRTSLPGVWFPAHSNVICIGKVVKIDPSNQ